MRRTCAKLCRKRGGDLEPMIFFAGALFDSDHSFFLRLTVGLEMIT
jgi:hypothetical protein